MEIKLLAEKRAVLVKIDGEIDHHIADSLRGAIDTKIRRTNAINVLFDFSEVSFMDSSGIGVIMGRYKQIKPLGGSVVIYGENAHIKRIVDMSGIGRIVKITRTLDEALKII